MHMLNVLPPTRVLRVTEHIRELQHFITDLIESGAAYCSGDGNVYFAVKSSGERYGQLDPSRGLQIDGEIARIPGETAAHSDKLDPRDFALWKRSDDQSVEGVWDSPWGRGRPGWHVECSAMSTAALGPFLDLHTGGIDLRFPHHTNELATAEAKLCHHQSCSANANDFEHWSHTWLHVGHLHLEGRKMSKSVKNFITIREFLSQGGTADAFRVFCLQHKYSSPVEYSSDRLADAQSFLGRLRRFILREPLTALKTPFRESESSNRLSMHSTCEHATKLHAQVATAEDAIEDALVDDFNTPRAMAEIGSLITTTNATLTTDGAWVSGAATLAYASASQLVRSTFSMLGISDGTLRQTSYTPSESDIAKQSHGLTDAFVRFRASVRDGVKRKDFGELFKLCDTARDDALSDFGIRITDKKDGSSSWSRE